MGFSLGKALKGAATGLISSGGNPWGAAIGGVAGAYMDSKAEDDATKQSQNWWKYQFNSANAFTKEQMQNRIQWSVEDAIKAGINPGVAAGAPSNVTGSAMPNTSMYEGVNARANTMNAEANQLNSDTARHAMRSQTMLNESNAYKNYKEAGLMDRNTAAREVQAHAAEMQAQAHAEHVQSIVNRINSLLPLEMQGQAQEIAIKAWQNKLNAREMRVLENTGLTLSEWKSLGKEITDVTKFAIGGRMARQPNSAKRIDYYDRNGEITGGQYITYK